MLQTVKIHTTWAYPGYPKHNLYLTNIYYSFMELNAEEIRLNEDLDATLFMDKKFYLSRSSIKPSGFQPCVGESSYRVYWILTLAFIVHVLQGNYCSYCSCFNCCYLPNLSLDLVLQLLFIFLLLLLLLWDICYLLHNIWAYYIIALYSLLWKKTNKPKTVWVLSRINPSFCDSWIFIFF